MEFTEAQWQGLADHCRERGVLFVSSPFSIEAVDLLERVGQPIWKIASGEVSNARLLDRVLETGAPGAAVDRHEPDSRRPTPRWPASAPAAATWACCSAPRPTRVLPNASASTWCPSTASATAAGSDCRITRPRSIRASPARRSASTCSRCTSRCRARCSGPTWWRRSPPASCASSWTACGSSRRCAATRSTRTQSAADDGAAAPAVHAEPGGAGGTCAAGTVLTPRASR